jgi:hypothetical protein
MPIIPDTQDWTWVLEQPCPECGFDASTFPRTGVAGLVRENAAEWQRILARPVAEVRRRPSDDQWSALEYACHVRDVFRIFERRLALMLTEDGPTFPNWDQDATAIDDGYAAQDPVLVAEELGRAAGVLADGFDAVTDEQWDRTGSRSDGAHFSIDTFSRYLIHDPVHHVHDVRCAS